MKNETMNIICEVLLVLLKFTFSTLQARAVETTMMSTWQVFGILYFFLMLINFLNFEDIQWVNDSLSHSCCAQYFHLLLFFFDMRRTHGHPIVVSLPACIYWNSYRTWRWAGSRWVLQYLQATASPAAILRLIGGHRPFLFASILFAFSIYLPSSWSPIFILLQCQCQKKIFQKRNWALMCPFFFLLPSWLYGQCAIQIFFVWTIFIISPNMDLMWSFFRVPDQHMRRCMTNPPVSETTINQHYHQQMISWTLGGCKIYLVKK